MHVACEVPLNSTAGHFHELQGQTNPTLMSIGILKVELKKVHEYMHA